MATESKTNNVFIEFDIVQNSNIEALTKELDLLVGAGKLVHIWSVDIDPIDIEAWCQVNGIWDYVWGYNKKDSFNYSKVDFIIDPNPRLVDRFKRAGVPGNVVERIE